MAAKSANETVIYPFIAFNFSVEIRVDGVAMQICDAAFSECDGLEMTMDVKTIREGGNNGKQIRLTGPLSFSSVTLKRGMTETFDLWKWVNLMLTKPETRADSRPTGRRNARASSSRAACPSNSKRPRSTQRTAWWR
jgi:phage tail-like protein